MFSRNLFFTGAISCLLTAASPPLSAQIGQSGNITGIAKTTDGSRIAGASVLLSGPDGTSRKALTALDGSFTFADLASGSYSLEAASAGFIAFHQSAVPVAVGRSTQLMVTLSLEGSRETVTVTAARPSFDSSQTSSVVNVDRDRIEELPIPSRNYLSFVALSPQATPANPSLSARTLSQSSGGFGFGGIRPSSNAVRIDGVGNDDQRHL
jgi:hypothetical protein